MKVLTTTIKILLSLDNIRMQIVCTNKKIIHIGIFEGENEIYLYKKQDITDFIELLKLSLDNKEEYIFYYNNISITFKYEEVKSLYNYIKEELLK